MIARLPSAAIQPAYNPIISYYASGGEQIVSVRISDDRGLFNQTFVREFIKERCSFDKAGILQALLFISPRTAISDGHWTDTRQGLSYREQYEGVSELMAVVNAAASYKGNIDFAVLIGTVLTKAQTVRKYAGYPVSVSTLAELTEVDGGVGHAEYVRKGEKIEVVTVEGALVVNIAVYDDTTSIATQKIGVVTIDSNPVTIKDDEVTIGGANASINAFIRVEHPCTPPAPFYVRWINSLGGYDYFMFSYRQQEKLSVKSSDFYTPSGIGTTPEATDLFPQRNRLSAEATESVVVGAANLSRNDMEVLRGLMLSNVTEAYDVENNSWYPLTMDKLDSSINTGETMQQVEFTFVLPEQAVQV